MQSTLSHIQVNVAPENLNFYQELFASLGWNTVYQDDSMLGVAGANNASIWVIGNAKTVDNDYDGPGVNHLGIGVGAQADVDTAAKFIAARNIEHLFETPRHRPDFSGDGPDTYYQVMFESPDRVLFEIVYSGPRSA